MRWTCLTYALLGVACAPEPPLTTPGTYRCAAASDCPVGWFCHGPVGDTRCWNAPQCTADGDPRCDDARECTDDACEAGVCVSRVLAGRCLTPEGCLDCGALDDSANCTVGACSDDHVTCQAVPAEAGSVCANGGCAGDASFLPDARCDGLAFGCPAPSVIPCPADDACSIAHCAGAFGCFTTVDATPACGAQGTWEMVAVEVPDACNPGCPSGPWPMIGYHGTVRVDATAAMTFEPHDGSSGQVGLGLMHGRPAGRVRFSGGVDSDWYGWMVPGGDLVVAARRDWSSLWLMTKVSSGYLAGAFAGRWQAFVLVGNGPLTLALHTGELTFGPSGCLAHEALLEPAEDASDPALSIASGACAPVDDSGAFAFTFDDAAASARVTWAGRLGMHGRIAIAAREIQGQREPGLVVLVRIADNSGDARIDGRYGLERIGYSLYGVNQDRQSGWTQYGGVEHRDGAILGGAVIRFKSGPQINDINPVTAGSYESTADGGYDGAWFQPPAATDIWAGRAVIAGDGTPFSPLIVLYPRGGNGAPSPHVATAGLALLVWSSDPGFAQDEWWLD